MTPGARLKRRVLRGAVRENVDTTRGPPPPSIRASVRLRRGAIQATLLVALPTLGLLAYNPLSGSGPDRSAVLASAPAVLTFRAPKGIGPLPPLPAVEKVVLAPGHGGNQSGARAPGGCADRHPSPTPPRHPLL